MFLGISLSTMAPAPLTATGIYFHCSYSRSFNNTQKFIILTVHSRKPWWNIIGSMAVFWLICLGPGADDRVTNTLFQILYEFTGRMLRSVIPVCPGTSFWTSRGKKWANRVSVHTWSAWDRSSTVMTSFLSLFFLLWLPGPWGPEPLILQCCRASFATSRCQTKHALIKSVTTHARVFYWKPAKCVK